MAEKKTTAKKTTSGAKPAKAAASKAAAPKVAAKSAAKGAAATARPRAVARPTTRTVTARPAAPAAPAKAPKASKPAAERPQAQPRPLATPPAGHALVVTAAGSTEGSVALPEALVGTERRADVMFQAFTAARANARQGNAATKNRARVAGGGAKPWRQKGTGRSRQGSTRSPLWRHGGVAFGPNGRTYWQRLPEKMRRAAFAQAFADHAARGRILVLDGLPSGEAPRTAEMSDWLWEVGDTGRTVIVSDGLSDRAARALRNLPDVEVRTTGALRLVDLLNGDTVLVARDALAVLARRAGDSREEVSA